MIRVTTKRKLLLKPEGAPDNWVCPRADMADVYVEIKPPTHFDHEQRWRFVHELQDKPPFNMMSLEAYEVWLCFVDTNLSILVPKRTEMGLMIWNEDKTAVKANEISFYRGMTIDEFAYNFKHLPLELRKAWHDRTLEVADIWKENHG